MSTTVRSPTRAIMSWCGWPEGGTSRASYGDAFADVYDQWYPPGVGDKATIDLIVELAAGRPVLELGVGTGRIAGEIAARGLSVWGVDSSAAMLEQLAAKPAGRHVS